MVTFKADDFSGKFKEMCGKFDRVVGVFVGDTDPDTGASWCSDCVAAKPMIKKVRLSSPVNFLKGAPRAMQREGIWDVFL